MLSKPDIITSYSKRLISKKVIFVLFLQNYIKKLNKINIINLITINFKSSYLNFSLRFINLKLKIFSSKKMFYSK